MRLIAIRQARLKPLASSSSGHARGKCVRNRCLLLGPPLGTKCHLFSSYGSCHLFPCARGLTGPRIPRPQGSRPRPRTLGPIRLRGGQDGSLGLRGHSVGVMAGRCGSARHAGGLRRPGGPAHAGGRQVSGPKTVGVRGHASGRRHHRTATEEPVITMIFQNRCWVSGPGVEFTDKGGEEPLSGEEGRAPPRKARTMSPCCKVPPGSGVSRVAVVVSATCDRPRSGEFLREGGPNDGWHTSTANSGSGPASPVRPLAPISLPRHYGLVSGTTTSGAARICCPMKNQLTPISLNDPTRRSAMSRHMILSSPFRVPAPCARRARPRC